MSSISIQEIQRDPADFLDRLVAGEAMLVLDGQRALATVTPLGEPNSGLPAGMTRELHDQRRLEVYSAEWKALTHRRCALIAKKYDQELTNVETAELERLQQLSAAALEGAFPRPRLSADELAELKRALATPVGGG